MTTALENKVCRLLLFLTTIRHYTTRVYEFLNYKIRVRTTRAIGRFPRINAFERHAEWVGSAWNTIELGGRTDVTRRRTARYTLITRKND